MPLEIHPLQKKDLEEVARMQHLAFNSLGRESIDSFLSPELTLSDESLAASVTRRHDMMQNNKTASFMTVLDSDLDKIIAVAIWEIFPQERTQDQVEDLARSPPPPPGAHPEAWKDFFDNLAAQRRKLGTRPFAILRSIATHPEYQRRGAGSLLMEQFVSEIEHAGVDGYIEASQMGKALYARFGFIPVFEKEFDLEKYGGLGNDINTVMIRPLNLKSSAT